MHSRTLMAVQDNFIGWLGKKQKKKVNDMDLTWLTIHHSDVKESIQLSYL